MKVPPCFFLSRLLIDRCKINIIKNYFYSSEYNNKLYNRVMSDGEIDQHNNKLNNKVIGSGNKFSQTFKNLWGAPIKYIVQNRN